jgi:hypothetical protein
MLGRQLPLASGAEPSGHDVCNVDGGGGVFEDGDCSIAPPSIGERTVGGGSVVVGGSGAKLIDPSVILQSAYEPSP